MNIFIINDENVYSDAIIRIIIDCGSFDLSNLNIDVLNSVDDTKYVDWKKYDIAFLDIEIGDKSGIDLAVKIKEEIRMYYYFSLLVMQNTYLQLLGLYLFNIY